MQKKSVYYIRSFNSNFRILSYDWPHPFSTMPTSNIFSQLLTCRNLYQHIKNQLIPSLHSWNTVNFRVQRPDWPFPLLAMPNQTIFNQLLILWICINMLKMRLFHEFVPEKYFWEHFGLYLRIQNFPKYGICTGTQQHKFLLYSKFSKN